MEEITGLNTLMAYLKSFRDTHAAGNGESVTGYRTTWWSSHNEYPILFALIAQYKPTNVIECGTCNGSSALTFAAAFYVLGLEGKIYTWDVQHRKPMDAETTLHDRIVRHIAPFSASVKDIVKVPGNPLLYFIDGDHGYESCKADIQTIKPLLRENDVIVFHDFHHEPVATAIADAFAGLKFKQDYVVPSKQGIKVMVYGYNG